MSTAAARVFDVPELLEMIQLAMSPLDLIISRRVSHTFNNSFQASIKIQRRLALEQEDDDSVPLEANDLLFEEANTEPEDDEGWFYLPFYQGSHDAKAVELPPMEMKLDSDTNEAEIVVRRSVNAEYYEKYWSLRNFYLTNKPCSTIRIIVCRSDPEDLDDGGWENASITVKNARLGEVLDVADRLCSLACYCTTISYYVHEFYANWSDHEHEEEDCECDCFFTLDDGRCGCGGDEGCFLHMNWEHYFKGLESLLTDQRPEVDHHDVWIDEQLW